MFVLVFLVFCCLFVCVSGEKLALVRVKVHFFSVCVSLKSGDFSRVTVVYLTIGVKQTGFLPQEKAKAEAKQNQE